jgi:hypothetical protein
MDLVDFTRGEAISVRRCDAASPLRQVEKCAGGTPNREGAVSPQAHGTP